MRVHTVLLKYAFSAALTTLASCPGAKIALETERPNTDHGCVHVEFPMASPFDSVSRSCALT